MSEKTNIPIYRAKKIDKYDEAKSNMINYAHGMLFYKNTPVNDVMQGNKHELVYYIQTPNSGIYKIDPSTLAIHFPDMIDGEGTKIFASLSGDGRGGDTFKLKGYEDKFTCIYNNGEFTIAGIKTTKIKDLFYVKVTGIQE